MKLKRKTFTVKDKITAVLHVNFLRTFGSGVRDACKTLGISPKQYYAWRKALDSDETLLEPKSKKPVNSPKKADEKTRELVIEAACSGKFRSAKKVKEYLASLDVMISIPTIIKVLEENGLYGFVQSRNLDGKLLKKTRQIITFKH